MGNYSAPRTGRGSKIYRMASTRNHRVFVTSLIVLIFGLLALYDGIVRPGAQTPISIILVFVIIGIALYGFYLFLTRSWDVFRHPDVKKFLSTGDPGRFIELFEKETTDGNVKKFRDAFVTRSFIVSETFYRFRWAHTKEIKLAYVERAGIRGIPFIGAATVVVHLENGTSIHIKCESVAEAETLLKTLAGIAPSARYVSARPEKSDVHSEVEAAARDVIDTIHQANSQATTAAPVSGIKPAASPPPAGVAQARPVPVRQTGQTREELFEKQVKDLYSSLEKENIAGSLSIMESIGASMNTGACDILAMLLEYPDDSVRARAAFTLGTLGQQQSVDPLIKALDDSSSRVRENAAIALGKIGDQRAVAPLQQVPTADVRVKKAAVSALARIDQKLNIFSQPDTGFFHTVK